MSNMEKYQKNESMYKSNESILDWVMGAGGQYSNCWW